MGNSSGKRNQDRKVRNPYAGSKRSPNSRGTTRVHSACKLGNKEDVIRILKTYKALEGSYNIDVENNECQTPLYWACEKGFSDIVPILLDHGASVDAVDSFGCSVIHAAARSGKEDIVSMLVEANANVNVGVKSKPSCLHYAAEKGNKEMLEVLLGANADITKSYNKSKGTPLHCASREGHANIISLLVDAGVNVEATCGMGKTALHYACTPEVLTALIEFGVPLDIKANNGRTALDLHLHFSRHHLVDILVHANCHLNLIHTSEPFVCVALAKNAERRKCASEILLEIGFPHDIVENHLLVFVFRPPVNADMFWANDAPFLDAATGDW